MKNLFLPLFLLVFIQAFSQTHLIEGFVAEENGRFLNASKITIIGNDSIWNIFPQPPNGWFKKELEPGEYEIFVEDNNYNSSKQKIKLDDQNIQLNFELKKIQHSSRLSDKILDVGVVYDPPLFWISENKDTLGLVFELSKLLEKRLKKKIIFHLVGYKDSPEQLRNGELDILMSGFIPSLQYPPDILWSYEFMEANYRLIVPIGSPITKVEDLKKFKGVTIGHFDEPVIEDWIEKNLPEANHIGYKTTDWYHSLANYEVDVIINESPYAKESIKPFLDIMKFIEEPVNNQGYALCIPPYDYKFLNKINNALSEILPSKKYRKIYQKYLNKKFEKKKFLELRQKRGIRTIKPSERYYIVLNNDTLKSIAKRYLGNENKWEVIWNINRNLKELKDPNLPPEGMQIVLPIN